jgi:hypothetical protein
MGNFYVNITTRKASQADIINFLESKGLSAFVISGPDDYVCIYESICDEQNTKHISGLLKEISKKYSCPAIGMLNHDDSLLAYELWSNGEKVDEYDSCPGYFDPDADEMEPDGGDATLIADLIGTSADVASVEKVLRGSGDDYIFAVERHEALAKALGLPPHTVGYGFGYLSEGETPQGITQEAIIKVKG